jgi:hypothetical protein
MRCTAATVSAPAFFDLALAVFPAAFNLPVFSSAFSAPRVAGAFFAAVAFADVPARAARLLAGASPAFALAAELFALAAELFVLAVELFASSGAFFSARFTVAVFTGFVFFSFFMGIASIPAYSALPARRSGAAMHAASGV